MRRILARALLAAGLACLALPVPAICIEVTIKGKVDLPPPAPKKTSEAIVYLEGDFDKDLRPGRAEMAQEGLEFKPHILAVTRGSSVEFPNLDNEYHNVFSYSKIKRFDLGRYRRGDTPAVQTFEQSGVVKLYCEIHRHMRGIILVLDTPYFVKAAENGDYSLQIRNLPEGSYTLTAWLDEKDVRRQKIVVKGAKPIEANFPAG